MNTVSLVGNLISDPEVKTLPSSKKVANFRVASNNPRNDKESVFIDVEAWEKLGELCGEYLSKGREVFIIGRLRTESWVAKEGGNRSKISLVADQVKFLGKPADKGGEQGDISEQPNEKVAASNEDLPF